MTWWQYAIGQVVAYSGNLLALIVILRHSENVLRLEHEKETQRSSPEPASKEGGAEIGHRTEIEAEGSET